MSTQCHPPLSVRGPPRSSSSGLSLRHPRHSSYTPHDARHHVEDGRITQHFHDWTCRPRPRSDRSAPAPDPCTSISGGDLTRHGGDLSSDAAKRLIEPRSPLGSSLSLESESKPLPVERREEQSHQDDTADAALPLELSHLKHGNEIRSVLLPEGEPSQEEQHRRTQILHHFGQC